MSAALQETKLMIIPHLALEGSLKLRTIINLSSPIQMKIMLVALREPKSKSFTNNIMPLSKNCISKNINKVCNLQIAHFVFMLAFIILVNKAFLFLSNSFHDGNDNCISALFISGRREIPLNLYLDGKP